MHKSDSPVKIGMNSPAPSLQEQTNARMNLPVLTVLNPDRREHAGD